MSSINYSMRLDLTVPETIGAGGDGENEIPVNAKLIDDILVRVLSGIGIQVNAIQTERTGDSGQISLRVAAPGSGAAPAAPAPSGGQRPGAVDGGPEQARDEQRHLDEMDAEDPFARPDEETPC